MNIYYLDASVWVKRYYHESGTTWVQDLFAQNSTLTCASLGFVEVAATLARKKKAGDIQAAEFDQKTRELEADWERFIQIQFTEAVVQEANTLTKTHALRGADAIHLASALHVQKLFTNEDDSLIFVTSDLELKQAAEGSHLEAIDPVEQIESEEETKEETEDIQSDSSPNAQSQG